nr:GspH/FimT family pseudopilin [uncultured Acetobacter sp.]
MTLRIKEEQGFTLLEVMIVLAIAGLFLSLMLEHGPMHSTLASFMRARDALLSTLHTARLDAMTKGEVVSVRFDAARFTLVEFSKNTILHQEALPKEAALLVPGPVAFQPDGLGQGGPWVLHVGARDMTVSISPLTGRIMTHGP